MDKAMVLILESIEAMEQVSGNSKKELAKYISGLLDMAVATGAITYKLAALLEEIAGIGEVEEE